ncbi:MAG: DUF4440 domain-containing protein [Pyrinomonadaceae bacterium]|nr:DUF4440 domain-containing protein [Pyrinomonadaceae bacterium]
MRIVTLMFIAVALLCTTAAAQLKSPRTAASQQMFDELAGKDSELFDAVFNSCNPDKLKELVTEDFEFYHDKWGQTAKSGAEFANAIRNLCERQKKGIDYRARRELDKNSVRVYPLNNYGAVQTGVHRFYKLTEGKKEELTETAVFTHLWKKDNGAWKLARVLSYDHRDPQGVALAGEVSIKPK